MTHIPSIISAGLTLSLTLRPSKYPAGAWSLVLLLRGPASYNLASTAQGESHVLTASAAETSSWLPGLYSYSLRAKAGDNVVELENGQLQVNPDLATLDGTYDPRTQAQKILDAVEAVLEKRATSDVQRYTINNRELWRTPLEELIKLRDKYRAIVQREKAKKAGRPLGRIIKHIL